MSRAEFLVTTALLGLFALTLGAASFVEAQSGEQVQLSVGEGGEWRCSETIAETRRYPIGEGVWLNGQSARCIEYRRVS